MLKNLFTGLPFFRRKKGHFPSEEEREARDKRLFVYRYNQGGESSRRCQGFRPTTLTAPVGLEPATSSSAFPAYSAISEITIILHSSRHPSLQDNPSAAHGIAHRPSASRART